MHNVLSLFNDGFMCVYKIYTIPFKMYLWYIKIYWYYPHTIFSAYVECTVVSPTLKENS